ncbi:MAG: hypothetical protein M1820_005360 [Bogoriella megaspora]|nr:MAG: hypothetical protein M1820_005360 [Bogoriella megaspora]
MPSLKEFMPKGYITSAILMSIGGFLNGYDTGSIGAITESPFFLSAIGPLSPFMRGFAVSIIMLMGAVPSVFAGHLADKLGRLPVVVIGALGYTVGAIVQGAAKGLPMFLVGRAVCGVAEGMFLSALYVYVTEIAPARSRGTIASMPQFGTCVGICAGYFTCYGMSRINSSISWRGPFFIQAGFSITLAFSGWTIPQSPRWLLRQGRRDEALTALDQLNFSRVEAEKDMLSARQEERAVNQSIFENYMMIFKRPYRSSTILALFVLGTVQFCGIDGILYYAPTLLAKAGIPGQSASFLASGLSAILVLFVSIPAFLFADRWGRRTITIFGGVVLSALMLLIGAMYASDSVHTFGAGKWVVIVSIFAFACTYAATWAVVSKIYSSEILPMQTRAAANSIAQGFNFFANWLVALITPILLASSTFGAYFLFGSLTLVIATALAVMMPETRGRSLESMQEAFQRPVMRSWAFQLRRLLSRATSGRHSGSSEHSHASGDVIVDTTGSVESQPGESEADVYEMSGALAAPEEGSATTTMEAPPSVNTTTGGLRMEATAA